jgi:hypothetical protein
LGAIILLHPGTSAEFHVAHSLRADRAADFTDIADDRADEKTVRAAFLRALIVARLSDASVAPTAIAITGAIIDGDLSCRGLGSTTNPLPVLDLTGCEIRGELDLAASCWYSVTVNDCRLRGLKAAGLRVENGLKAGNLVVDSASATVIALDDLVAGADVEMWNLDRTTSDGAAEKPNLSIELRRARVNGSIFLSGARLKNTGGDALTLNSAEITGSVFLRESTTRRFEAAGGVNIGSATIGRTVECGGGHFNNANGEALSLNAARVAGSVFLHATNTYRFESKGKVTLGSAKIGGTVECGGSSFDNAGGDALSLNSADVAGAVFLRASDKHRLEAKGRVDLTAARVRGVVDCTGSSFENADSDALTLNSAVVGGAVFLNASATLRFEAKGRVTLGSAKIGSSLECIGACFENPKAEALTVADADVTGSVFLSASATHRFEAKGQVNLRSAKIGSAVDCTGGYFENPTGDALSLDSARVARSVFLRAAGGHRFEAKGCVRIQSANVGGQLSLGGALLENPGGDALSMEHSEIRESVFLRHREGHPFESSGRILMTAAKIGSALQCYGKFNSPGELLNLESADIGRDFSVFLAPESSGTVSLRGAHVEELADDGGNGWSGWPTKRPADAAMAGVLLKLDGFTYERLGVWTRPAARGWQQLTWPMKRTVGLGVERDIWWHRARWLERQHVGHSPRAEDFFPQPHEQLAKVLRLMGHDYDARRIMAHKFAHESRCGANEILSRFFMFLYRVGFGCGYLPIRALVTVLAWLFLGWLCISHAVDLNDSHNVVFVRSTTGVDVVRTLSKPDEEPKSPSTHTPYSKFETRDIACDEVSPFLYALDTMLPVMQLHMEGKCEFSDSKPGRLWRLGRAFYAMIGWIIVTLAALTWTGVLRKEPG